MLFCHIDRVRISRKNLKPPGGRNEDKTCAQRARVFDGIRRRICYKRGDANAPTEEKRTHQHCRFAPLAAPELRPRLLRVLCSSDCGFAPLRLRAVCKNAMRPCPRHCFARLGGCCFCIRLIWRKVLPPPPPVPLALSRARGSAWFQS